MEIKLKEVRESKNLTQRQLAQLSGVSKSTISRTENNQTSPRMIEMEWIAIALGVKFTDLYITIAE